MKKPSKLRRIVVIVLSVIGVVVAFPVVLLAWAFTGIPPTQDGKELNGGAHVVKDGYVAAFLLPAGHGTVALIDCGNDIHAVALLAALAKEKLDADAVRAIFLTHGHPDHTNGCAMFPHAELYAGAADVELAEGKEGSGGPLTRFIPPDPNGLTIGHAVVDGEMITVGDLKITGYATPGHTKGSTTYLANGVLYFGDSADAKKDGSMTGSKWLFSEDTKQNKSSLLSLESKLEPSADSIKTLVFAHSGTLDGFAPFKAFAKK